MTGRFDKSRLPRLGVGLSFRTEMAEAIYGRLDEIDFLEVIVDTAFWGLLHPDFYARTGGRLPVVAHGVNASLGSLDRPRVEDSYLEQVATEVARLGSPWLGEHLAFTRADGVDAGQLLPLQRTEETIDFVAAKIRHMREAVGIPVLIENLAYYFEIPGAEMSEAEFVCGVLEAADCGLLLDVNNLYANGLNQDFDPIDFADRIPADRVVEIHVAGGEDVDGLYIDTHGHPVGEGVMALLEHVCRTKQPNAVVLEREKNLPEIGTVMDELVAIRAVWERSCAPVEGSPLCDAV
jgi:uncharacterized protein (UPF0276 family)